MKRWLPIVLGLGLGLEACRPDQQGPNGQLDSNATNSTSQEPLFTLVSAPALTAAQAALLTRIRNRVSTAAVNVARLTGAPKSVLQNGAVVVFDLSPTRRVVARGSRTAEWADGLISWAGSLTEETGWVQLVLTDKGVTGTLRTATSVYTFEPIGGGLHALSRVGQFPPEHSDGGLGTVVPPSDEQLSAIRSLSEQAMASVSGGVNPRINVLVAYTPAAAAAVGDIAATIQLAFDETNTSYANSGVAATVANAFESQVSYDETGRTYTQHVTALQNPSDGIMDVVQTWRNQYRGDVVVLLVTDDEACGQAYQIYGQATGAFAVVNVTCATGNYSFGHEIGHLQGARHDRAVDATNTPFQYGHGYVDPNHQWRTIMAYPNACGGCIRVQYWSSPNVTYPPTGQVMGTTTYEDNVRVLSGTAPYVAAYRLDFTTSISGPTYMYPGATCYYYGSASGGVAPYTYYNWSWDTWGSIVGYSPSNGTFMAVAEGSTGTWNIYVAVSDALGNQGWASKAITVRSDTNICHY